jgi:hypothetical protein
MKAGRCAPALDPELQYHLRALPPTLAAAVIIHCRTIASTGAVGPIEGRYHGANCG